MFADTHCHLNMIVKNDFDKPLSPHYNQAAQQIVDTAYQKDVKLIINVGTSLIESMNCIQLAQHFAHVWATVGLHPNDCTADWMHDLKEIKKMVYEKEKNKIVGIGECGMDFHYPDYNEQRQRDAFKAQIELALEHNIALIIHTRDAAEETLRILEEFAGQIKRAVIHCFSENDGFAQQVISWGFMVGIGGTITYPKNNILRSVAHTTPLEHIVLETDAPFLPPQIIRGKKNHPMHIATIAQFLAALREVSVEKIAEQTTINARNLFGIFD